MFSLIAALMEKSNAINIMNIRNYIEMNLYHLCISGVNQFCLYYFCNIIYPSVSKCLKMHRNHTHLIIQWKPLIMITLGLVLFNNNNRLITLSRGYKNLHSLTQFIVTVQHFTCIKTTKFILKTYVLLPVACLQLVVPE